MPGHGSCSNRQIHYARLMSQPARAKKRARYEDLLQLPDHLVAEILNGELFATPRPAAPHAHVASRLNGRIDRRLTEDEGGREAG